MKSGERGGDKECIRWMYLGAYAYVISKLELMSELFMERSGPDEIRMDVSLDKCCVRVQTRSRASDALSAWVYIINAV